VINEKQKEKYNVKATVQETLQAVALWLDFDIVGIGQMQLCINKYPVTGFQFHVAVGYQGLVSALY